MGTLWTIALAAESAVEGDHVTAPDAWTGASIAYAAVNASLGLVRGNLAMLSDSTLAQAPLDEARTMQHRADALLEQARNAVRHVAG